ncbi:hypothetical protein DICVIV_07677 [Dictyocaulus viviparus]|uniref:Transmembrane protein n=1 Tax=Dictyocaulus viviparus TaxID=29172 RepID=A0A0D8XV62_DICVI|nr:hypothetical protein DICVIV_07677 [Dictyocaulus viviparus]
MQHLKRHRNRMRTISSINVQKSQKIMQCDKEIQLPIFSDMSGSNASTQRKRYDRLASVQTRPVLCDAVRPLNIALCFTLSFSLCLFIPFSQRDNNNKQSVFR